MSITTRWVLAAMAGAGLTVGAILLLKQESVILMSIGGIGLLLILLVTVAMSFSSMEQTFSRTGDQSVGNAPEEPQSK